HGLLRPRDLGERGTRLAPRLGRLVQARQVRAYQVQHRPVALVEFAASTVEREHLGVSERRVEADQHWSSTPFGRKETLNVSVRRNSREVMQSPILCARKSPVAFWYWMSGCWWYSAQ